MLKNSQQNREDLSILSMMRSMLLFFNTSDVSQKREQHLADLKAIRESISPACTVTDEEREQHLADLEAIRKSVSPACTVTDEEREENLAYRSYLNENIRRR